jgi:hypothetical protein
MLPVVAIHCIRATKLKLSLQLLQRPVAVLAERQTIDLVEDGVVGTFANPVLLRVCQNSCVCEPDSRKTCWTSYSKTAIPYTSDLLGCVAVDQGDDDRGLIHIGH